MTKTLATLQPYGLSLFRLVTGLLFMEHGTAKLLGFPFVAAYAHVPYWSEAGFTGTLELVGGALVALGLFTRLAAFILSGEMAFAYFLAHAPHGFFPLLNHGEPAVLYCFAFLYLFLAGGGPISLGRVLCRHRAAG